MQPNKCINPFALAHWDRQKAAARYANRYVFLELLSTGKETADFRKMNTGRPAILKPRIIGIF